MAVNEEIQKYIFEQLSEFGEFESKKMFGGLGIFRDGIMFAMIGKDIFRLRVDEETKPDFEKKGMKPHHSDSKKKGMPYWEVPAEVLEDKSELKIWAQKAFEVAKKAKN